MAKLISSNKDDITKDKYGDGFPVSRIARHWNMDGPPVREILKKMGLKPKRGISKNKEVDFYPYLSPTQLRKTFKGRDETLERIIKAMGRKDKSVFKKRKPKKITVTRAYKKRVSKKKSRKGNKDHPLNDTHNQMSFILDESGKYGLKPEKYLELIGSYNSSGHFQTA